MTLVGFITKPVTVRQITEYLDKPTKVPATAPARSPQLGIEIGPQVAASIVVNKTIPVIYFVQMTIFTAKAWRYQLLENAGLSAELICELEFE